jgi:dimethylargininase
MIAVTRGVSRALASCELAHLPRVAIDVDRAEAQHAEYERALVALGCSIQRLGARDDLPDSVFVEDTAVVLDEIAVLTRPGAESRRPEVPAVAELLRAYRPLTHIEPPGTMDGGDVMVAGRTIFVGISRRTNRDALEQLRRIAAPLGYAVRDVLVERCLHLKSSVTVVDDRTLLINPAWSAAGEFRGFDLLDVDPGEAAGANVVRVGSRLLYSAGYPRTRERLERRGFDVTAVDVSELAKAEGAVTCCSVIFGETRAG